MADGKVLIETELDTKQFDKQIAKLQADLDRYVKVLESDAKVPISLRMSEEEKRELEATIEKTKNQLISLQEQARKTGQEGSNAGQTAGNGFEKGLTSLKRFALGLFGVRSAFSLLRRATNTYLSQNEATANKINAIWTALGNALAPVIEIIADGILKLIGYLQVFLNALGWKVDLTKNMNKNTKAVDGTTGAIKKQTKALKELENQTASFDEMNVVQKQNNADTGDYGGGGGGAGSSIADAFKMPPLDPTIVQKLKDLAHWLKENWDWIWKVGVALGAVFAVGKLAGVLGGINGLIGGASFGLLGLLAVLGALLALDIKSFLDDMDELTEIEKQQTTQTKGLVKEDKKLIDAKKEENKAYKVGSKELSMHFDYLRTTAEQYASNIKRSAEYVDNLSGLAYWVEEGSGKVDEYNHQLSANNDGLRNSIEAMAEMYNQGQLTADEQEKFFEILGAVNGRLVDGTVIYDDISSRILEASKETEKYDKLMNVLGTDVVNSNYKQAKAYKDLLKNTKDSFKQIGQVVARPKVEVQVDTKKLSTVFDTLSNMDSINPEFASKFAWAKSKLKAAGLARGGIVNLPGKGVSLSNVIMGEATGGQEGVVPLNNEESMSLIGQAVAKYVNINLTNNTMLDGKVIAREQRVISNNIDFATNGRGV